MQIVRIVFEIKLPDIVGFRDLLRTDCIDLHWIGESFIFERTERVEEIR